MPWFEEDFVRLRTPTALTDVCTCRQRLDINLGRWCDLEAADNSHEEQVQLPICQRAPCTHSIT